MAWVVQTSAGRYVGKYRGPDGRVRSAPGGPYTHKRAAERAAGAAEAESRQLGWRDPAAAGRTWAEWCSEWWPSRHVEASTMKNDVARRDLYVLPRWGDVRLIDITRQDIKAWAAELATYETPDGQTKRRAAETVRRIVNILAVSLQAAVDAEILTANPAARLGLPSGGPGKERYLTREELDAICEHLDGEYLAMTLLLAGTGLRWGEAAGLHRARVDTERGALDVIDTWSLRGHHMKPYPKGKRRRRVPVPTWVDLSSLEQEAASADCGYDHVEGHCPGPLLLTTPNGTIVEHSKFTKRFAAAVRKAGVGRVRVHDLRHTYASWLIQGGRPLAEVGKLLGHVSPITTQRYAHLGELDADDVLAALGPGPASAARSGDVVDELAERRRRRGLA